ncbi:hypothetical protein A3Q56_07526 [Intoshia linei]|uniref:CUB domain-containing protein n=1 Tax=Intoshia linei TaxID=1819745 RepID=A0A177ATR3_9BILA|nr:hypothetical protein A3Q56_07526 [Intoshia linei]
MKKIFFVIILINKIYFNEGTWNVPSVEIEPKDSTCKNRNIFIGHFSYTCIDVCPFSEYSYDSASLKDINIICNGQDQYFSKDLLLEYFYSLYNGMHQCNFAISPYEDNFNFIATFIIINKTDSFQFDFDEVSILFTTYSFSITRNQNSNKYTYEEGSWVMLIVTKKYIKKSERKGEIKIKIKKDEFGYNYTTLQNNIKIVMKKVPVEETQIKISYIRFVALYNIKNLQNYEWYMDEQGHPNFDKNCKCANNNQYDTPTQTYPYKRSELKFVGPVPFFYDDLIDDVQSNDCLVMLNTTHYKITSVYEQGFRIYSPERAITDTSLLTKWISSPEYNIINVNVINKATVCSNDYVLVVRLVVSIQSIRVYTDNKTLYEIVCSPQYGCSSRWSGTLGFTIRDSKCKKIAIQLTRRSSDNTLPVAFINKISTFTK